MKIATFAVAAMAFTVPEPSRDIPTITPLPPSSPGLLVVCSAQRPEVSREYAHRHYDYVAIATVTDAREFEQRAQPIQNPRVRVRIDSFLKGRFAPTEVTVIFHTACGMGGPSFANGDSLALYINVYSSVRQQRVAKIDHWWMVNRQNRIPAQHWRFSSRPPTPRGNSALWITGHDYPSSALRNKIFGKVQLDLTVNPDGRVELCKIRKSSGDLGLDDTSCRLLTRRARYRPSVAGLWFRTMFQYQWKLPSEES